MQGDHAVLAKLSFKPESSSAFSLSQDDDKEYSLSNDFIDTVHAFWFVLNDLLGNVSKDVSAQTRCASFNCGRYKLAQWSIDFYHGRRATVRFYYPSGTRTFSREINIFWQDNEGTRHSKRNVLAMVRQSAHIMVDTLMTVKGLL